MTDSSHPVTQQCLFTRTMPQPQQLGLKKTENKTKKWVRLKEGGKQNWKVEKTASLRVSPNMGTARWVGGVLAEWTAAQGCTASQSIWLSSLSCQSGQEGDWTPDGLTSPTLRQVLAGTCNDSSKAWSPFTLGIMRQKAREGLDSLTLQ